jgi:putative membrane protein
MLRVLNGSIMMILLDLLIEISAPKLDYWEFAVNPVPLSNYLWWFIFSILFHFIYQSNIKKEYVVSTNILVIHFLFFGLLALFL